MNTQLLLFYGINYSFKSFTLINQFLSQTFQSPKHSECSQATAENKKTTRREIAILLQEN